MSWPEASPQPRRRGERVCGKQGAHEQPPVPGLPGSPALVICDLTEEDSSMEDISFTLQVLYSELELL